MGTLIKLVDRIRMLDNDMIRMNMKLAMVLEHRHLLDKNLNKEQQNELDEIIDKYQSRSQVFDSTGGSPKKESDSAGKK
jgi:predicted RecB family endonuclease